MSRVADGLAGRVLLLTGATGFVGKAVLSTCLRELPGLAEIRLLIRAGDDEGAVERLTSEILTAAALADLRSTAEEAMAAGRLTAFAADLSRDQLGREDTEMVLEGVDVAINSAASAAFGEPLDALLELNSLGPRRLLRGLHESGSFPHFVHLSTVFCGGMCSGVLFERSSGSQLNEPQVDLEQELEVARCWRRELEVESRLPEHQRRFAGEALGGLRAAGRTLVGVEAERLRRQWIDARLVERGRERARGLGWQDGYSLSRSLGERLLVATASHPLTIIRPSGVTAALRRPFPGWLESLDNAAPLISICDLIPVDFVANAAIVAAADPPAESPRTIAVVSGTRNPVSQDDPPDVRFDDRKASELRERMDPEDREVFGFDPAAIEWRAYLGESHTPTTTGRPLRGLENGG